MPQRAVFPAWFHAIAIGSLAIAAFCTLFLALDVLRRPQKMGVMNIVWPLTALFGSLLWVAAYLRWGRRGTESGTHSELVSAAIGSSHCGAGCTLGDIIAEWSAFAFPAIAIWFGWHSLFADKIFAVWVADFILAFIIGILFQYFSIKPMRDLSVGRGIIAALKADILSISAWQIGMYGGMAVIQFGWFAPRYGGLAQVASPEFWLAMQIAMLAGFATSYPVNLWLLKIGWKEAM
ncbi:DUF4396 domain-containing protein [Sphingomonas oligoaromativorans]|uniref:DUF4396 domain-containing protein n=1 Tax=Sphingomonas oligoaromativorans TaxID=575322 RepID=UPI001420E59D|nr:DUF4396 domain-containing protein [Sphingomonas oligoaromativorans]NIJ33393.1 hypothetical protein [Sphingomonas oligoaromativorans]